MIVTKHLRIYGTVQGVGYRISLTRAAERENLTGWVRNRSDGSVEAILQGPEDGVQRVIEWCKQGPRGARVERFEMSDGEGVFPEFALLPSV